MNKPLKNQQGSYSLTPAKKHILDHAELTERFNQIFRTSDVSKILQFIEEFVQTYPLSKNILLQMYRQISQLGLYTLANEIALIYLNTTKKLREVAEMQFGLPPIFSLETLTNDMGDLVDQAVLTRFLVQSGSLKQKPVLPLYAFQEFDFVRALVPYFEDSFEVVSDNNDCKPFQLNAAIAPYNAVFYQVSESRYGPTSSFFYEADLEQVQKIIRPHPFSLKEVTSEAAMKFLKPLGFEPDHDFVVIQFLNNQLGDVNKYIKAIEYLLDQGLKVFRVGDNKANPLLEKNGFVDLTQVERPAEVDIFLCSKAKFYLGHDSGFYSLAHNFGTPCGIISGLDYCGTRSSDFVQHLKIFSPERGGVLSFSDLCDLDLKGRLSAKILNDRQLTPQVPSSQQNIKFVKEILDYLERGSIYQFNEEVKIEKRQHKIHGSICSENFSLLQ